MLDPLQFYCWVLCNGMKTRFRMVMIAHPGPGIGFHKRFMWRIIIPPTARCQHAIPACLEMSGSENIPRCPCMVMHLIESSHDLLSSGYMYDSVPLGRAMMEHDSAPPFRVEPLKTL